MLSVIMKHIYKKIIGVL